MATKGQNTVLAPNLALGMNPAADGQPLWVQNLTRLGGDGGWTTRPGFGLLARCDSALTAGKLSSAQDLGISRVLGSTAIRTPWGSDQILALCRVQAWTTDQADALMSQRNTVYSLLVYDTGTDSCQEHPLHWHTGQEQGKENWQKHGVFDTDVEVDRQHFIDAGAAEVLGDRQPVDREDAWFTAPFAIEGTTSVVVFGTARAGAWVYAPALPSPNLRGQANATSARDWNQPYSESPVVYPLNLKASNTVEDGYTYVTDAEFGRPSAAVVVEDRIAFAVGNLVWWSDPQDPSSVVAENVDAYPEEIRALGAILGILYVFTAHSTYICAPARGFVVSGGDIRCISRDVGAEGPQSVVNYANSLAFAHRSGVFALNGSASMQRISDPIDNFFSEGIESPWSHFLADSLTSLGVQFPAVYYRHTEQNAIGAHLSADNQGRLYAGYPALDLVFVFEAGGWHVWNFQTAVNPAGEVAVTANLPYLRVNALGGTVYAVAGPTVQAQTDESVPSLSSAPNRSVAFLRLDYGGALDRASGPSLAGDQRHNAGEWVPSPINPQVVPHRDRGYFLLAPAEIIPPGTAFPWAPGTSIGAESAFWVPIDLVPPKAAITPGALNLTSFELRLDFDNTNWAPVTNLAANNPYEALFDLPVERLSASAAYSLGVADHATPQGVYVFNTGTGLPDPAGDQIRIIVDSAFGGAWTGFPEFQFLRRTRNPLLRLAFVSKGGSGALTSLAIQASAATVTNGTPTTYPIGALVWHQTPMAVNYEWHEVNNSEAQAVDWMVHGAEIAADGQQMLARGAVARVQSTGQSTANTIGANYPRGLFALAMSASRKDVSGQQYEDIEPTGGRPPGYTVLAHDPVAPRLGNPVSPPVFAGTATWGDDATPATGNVSVADTATDRLQFSGRMKGDALNLTLFGHVRDRAERLKLYTVEAVVRIAGGAPRRRGR